MAVEAAAIQVTLPVMGESVTEGTILEWHKQEGDTIEADEILVEVSTDKVDAEVPSPASGTVVIVGGLGPFAGSAGFVYHERRVRREESRLERGMV